MVAAPQWMREPVDEVPGVAVIMHQLGSSGSCTMFIDSIKVYRDRIYLHVGLKFRDPESWRAAAISPDVLMRPETFRATVRYQDGETILASSHTSAASMGVSAGASTLNAPGSLVQISSEGASLQWYVDYLLLPIPTEDIVFSAEFPRIELARRDWLLSRSTVEECVEIGSRYTIARKAAEEDGYTIETNLNSIAKIAGRLAHLSARVDFGNAKLGWEPAVRVPVEEREVLSIYEILSHDALSVTISGHETNCYLLEISGGRSMQIIALSNDVTKAAEMIIAGLHNGYQET